MPGADLTNGLKGLSFVGASRAPHHNIQALSLGRSCLVRLATEAFDINNRIMTSVEPERKRRMVEINGN